MSSVSVSHVVPRNLNGNALHLEHRPWTDQDKTCRPASAAVLPVDLTLARHDALDSAAILADMSPRMEATVRAVTSHTEELRCDELVDRDPLPLWGEGVVTVPGDAAHPLLPNTGQGRRRRLLDAAGEIADRDLESE